MQPVLMPSMVERGRMAGYEEKMPSRCTTTLYDLIAALQAVVGPDEDALVVATVAHLLQSGQLRWHTRAQEGGRPAPDGGSGAVPRALRAPHRRRTAAAHPRSA
jgi:hypothetical protein